MNSTNINVSMKNFIQITTIQRIQKAMNKNTQNNRNNCVYSGLYLFGKIIDRTWRKVPKDNPTTEIVTYLVQSSRDSKFYVDDYAPASYYELGTEWSGMSRLTNVFGAIKTSLPM